MKTFSICASNNHKNLDYQIVQRAPLQDIFHVSTKNPQKNPPEKWVFMVIDGFPTICFMMLGTQDDR